MQITILSPLNGEPKSSTTLPFIGNAPDYLNIQEPSLSVLQNVFVNGVENVDYFFLPDPEPPQPEPPQPDWQGIGFAVLTDEELFDFLESSPKFYLIYPYLINFAAEFNPALYLAFVTTWNLFAPSVLWTPERIAQINSLLQQYYIPIQLNENGMIVLS